MAFTPSQWNVMSSRAGTLRGVHVHPTHDDYLVMVEGCMTLGLADLRSSPSPAWGMTLELAVDDMTALLIPHGVAHGFYFPVDSTLLYGVSRVFDPVDELGCRWDDPELGIPWAVRDPILSERDLTAGPFGALLDEFAGRR
jgi:dTDP-4-dehydrorhamnose 3,5-epimerase